MNWSWSNVLLYCWKIELNHVLHCIAHSAQRPIQMLLLNTFLFERTHRDSVMLTLIPSICYIMTGIYLMDPDSCHNDGCELKGSVHPIWLCKLSLVVVIYSCKQFWFYVPCFEISVCEVSASTPIQSYNSRQTELSVNSYCSHPCFGNMFQKLSLV